MCSPRAVPGRPLLELPGAEGSVQSGAWKAPNFNKLLLEERRETRCLPICFLLRVGKVFSESGSCFHNQTHDSVMLSLLQEQFNKYFSMQISHR